MRRFAQASLITLLAGLCLVPPTARAAVLQAMTIEQMTAASTEIVQGSVTGSYVALSGGTIFTHYTVQVSERLKGPANPSTDVAVPGGSLNGLRQSFPGLPVLTGGQQYLLFLWQGPKSPNQPVGMGQGILQVSATGTQQMAFRPASGEMMIGANGKAVTDRAVRMKLSDLRTRVSAALARGGQSK